MEGRKGENTMRKLSEIMLDILVENAPIFIMITIIGLGVFGFILGLK
jgi:hypothetical protein